MMINNNDDYSELHSHLLQLRTTNGDPIDGATMRWETDDELGVPLVKEFFERKRDKEKIENEYGFK